MVHVYIPATEDAYVAAPVAPVNVDLLLVLINGLHMEMIKSNEIWFAADTGGFRDRYV